MFTSLDSHARLTALFIGSPDQKRVPTLAAKSGFRSILGRWHHSEPRHQGVSVRDAFEIDDLGGIRPIPGTVSFRPSLIAVLDSSVPALERGYQLPLGRRAVWSHLEHDVVMAKQSEGYRFASTDPGGLCVAPNSTIAVGVVETQRTPPFLRLGFLTLIKNSETSIKLNNDKALEAVVRKTTVESLARLLPMTVVAQRNSVRRIMCPIVVRLGPEDLHISLEILRRDPANVDSTHTEFAILEWLRYLRRSLTPAPPFSLSQLAFDPIPPTNDLELTSEFFPALFQTPKHVWTELVDGAFLHLDPDLVPRNYSDGADCASELRDILFHRRTFAVATAANKSRLVETGVGRACLLDDIKIKSQPHFRDFTVLGVGLTQFSENGFMEMGRTIDGKAALIRAWHRKACAERLENAGCRAGKVVAIIKLASEEIEMSDGKLTPACLAVRAFRCAFRVKQLDSIVCSLHSVQHTPLISAFLTERAHELRFEKGLPDLRGLADDEALAREIEMQGASQLSLRKLVASPTPSPGNEDWPPLIREVRLELIDSYSRAPLNLAKRRLAEELDVSSQSISDVDYLFWFAKTLGQQLNTWKRLRFLHDYHHRGVSRWQPETLFSLGENNVSLLAEFPDLDTSLFVDDDEEYLMSTLQLQKDDVEFMRGSFSLLHHREVLAAEEVVRTLANIMFREDPEVLRIAIEKFRAGYEAIEDSDAVC
jgi:hypothetical protein